MKIIENLKFKMKMKKCNCIFQKNYMIIFKNDCLKYKYDLKDIDWGRGLSTCQGFIVNKKTNKTVEILHDYNTGKTFFKVPHVATFDECTTKKLYLLNDILK